MVIFSSSILITGKTAFIIAALSSLLYSLIIMFERLKLIPHQDYFSPLTGLQHNPSYIILTWSFSVFSFFAFAALASYLAGLLQKRQKKLAEANQVLDKKNKTMLLLYKTSKALNSYRSVKDIVDYILTELLEHLKLDRSLLYLNIRGEFLHLYMIKENRASERNKNNLKIDIPMKESAGLTARAAVYKQAFNITEPENSPFINRELALKIGMNPFALAPLVLRDELIGVIGIDRSYKNGSINDEEFQILQMFANQAAITIKSLRYIDDVFARDYA
ncbi:MAG: GAF domain-containing protein [Spirochaetota bacterium]